MSYVPFCLVTLPPLDWDLGLIALEAVVIFILRPSNSLELTKVCNYMQM